MADDAMLVSDNIFHDGDVLESRYAVLRRDRTIHGRMREYLQVLCEKEELETICLPIADGMTISTKKEMERESNSWTIIEKSRRFLLRQAVWKC